MNPPPFCKKMTLMLALACICVGLSAKPITREQAQARAAEFLTNVTGSRRLAPVTNRAKLGPRRAVAVTKAELDLYYVFNRGTNEGYVIVSGDDQTLPVLGYTDSGEFDYEQLPANMRSWLKGYENQLADIREHPERMAAAPRYAPVHDAIDPMITTRWNQGSPYNDECPMYFTLGRSVTGCVATAFAQVLNYWGEISVTETQADMPAYKTRTSHATLGNLSVDGIPAGSPIDWANMLDTYGSSATGVQKKAVAQLMHYCGVSVEMDYTNSASGAYSYMVAEAAVKYFGYTNSVRYVQGDTYTADGWDALLYGELAAGRPFYLSGSNSDGGHAFVCDGYDGNHCFHINWGWGGSSDGYFLITRLNPSSQGIGGSDGGYSGGPEAVIGMQPPVNSEKEVTIANNVVKKLCVSAFDADGDGKLTYAEVEAVTDLGTTFRGTRIASFAELYNFTSLTTIADSTFAGCAQLATIRLPKQLKHIGKAAFAGCKALKSISVPEGTKEIAADAFADCAKLTSFIPPQSLTTIGDRAFRNCAAFTQATLPIGVQQIGSEAYAGCTKLTEVTVKSIVPQNIHIADDAFANIDLSEVQLNVTQGTGEYFAAHSPWNTFGHIHQVRDLAQGHFAPLKANKKVFLYNVGTGRYLTRGEAYGTQAVVAETDNPMLFELRQTSAMGTGVYALFTQEFATSGNYLFRTSSDGRVGQGVKACFVDGSMSKNGQNTYWKVVEVADHIYTFQTPAGVTGHKEGEFFGINTSHASNEASPTYGAYSDVAYDDAPLNCQWMLVEYDEERMTLYAAATVLDNLIHMASQRRISASREQAVSENMDATMADIERAQRSLRKRLGLIQFADNGVRDLCIENWDANTDGELSYTEAKALEYMKQGIGFNDNANIVTFDEFQYFTNVNSINDYSFRNCSNLRSIIMPDGLEDVSFYAFSGCKSLERVQFGRSLTNLDEEAFNGCTALKEVILPVADPATITVNKTAFRNTRLANATLYVPVGSKELYAAAPYWKNFGNIVEIRTTPQPSFAPLKTDEPVYIYNIGTRRYITNGEAYGTQAVVGKEGLRYQLKHTKSMKDGQYYLQTDDFASGKNVLFRTSTDTKVGEDVWTCFVDGSASTKAYWQVTEVDPERHIYTFQTPSTDAQYKSWLFLGTDYYHQSEYVFMGTNGLYYDVSYEDSPENCQWAFIRIADIDSINTLNARYEQLKSLIGYAREKELDVTAEQAVYDNVNSSLDDVDAAVESLRKKLNYIDFADSRAKTISVYNWDENEDEELSLEEAAAVTRLGTAFRTATGMHTFAELQYFTALTEIPVDAFRNSAALQTVYIPAGVTTIGKDAFYGCNLLKFLVLLNPTKVVSSEATLPATATIFVPAALVEAYKADEHWAQYRICEYTGKPVVTAEDQSRNYGRPNPTFTYTVSGAPISGEPELNSEADSYSVVGTYAITPTAGTIITEGVEYQAGTLTVLPSPLSISVGSYTRNIGEPNPEFELTYRSFRNREKADVLLKQPIVECDATPESPAGEYEIRVYGAEAQNYDITYVNGILTVIDPAGIAGISTSRKTVQDVYDLQGRKLGTTDQTGIKALDTKGVYIIGDRKVVVK